jgi:RNA polymerase sigma-70 factor (ECF subfamily)
MLIERAREGDLEAFDGLVRRYQDRVFTVAYRMVGNEEDAADVAQEVFLACFRHLKSFRGNAKLATWLHRITVNMVKNLWSRQKRQGYARTDSLDATGEDNDPPLVQSLADPAPNPRRRAAGNEIYRVIECKMLEIDPEFRQVLILRFIEGLSYDEIASITDEPLGTIKSRIFRARRALKDAMQDHLQEL